MHAGGRKQLSAMLAIFGLQKLKVNQSRNQRKKLFNMYFHTTLATRETHIFFVCLQSVDEEQGKWSVFFLSEPELAARDAALAQFKWS